MKLVVIIPYFFPRIGGLENYALKISQGLINLGWQVTVITSNPNGVGEVNDKVGKISVIRLGTSFRASNTPVGLNWKARIKDLLKEIKPDLVNAHTPVPFISDVGIEAANELQIPTVLTYQNDIFKDNPIFKMISFLYYTLLGNKTLSLANKVIITSAHYGEISEKLRPFAKKLVVIPPGVDLKPFSGLTDSNQKYVLFVGQLDTTHRHKGLNYLIDAFSLLKDSCPDLKLFVIGKGNDLERYELLIKSAQLEDRIVLKGFVPENGMSKYYANALCLCLPSVSQSEGFGMVIIEAGSQKTPSIGSNVGGIPSVILDKKTGLLVPPRNAKALAENIVMLYKNPKMRNEMGLQAYTRVVADFIWDKQIEKTDVLFRSLIL